MRIIYFCLLCVTIVCSSSLKGNPTPLKDVGPRIVNGKNARDGQFPWQVGILAQSASGAFFCGGSIISEEWVLTAGHCVDGMISAFVYYNTAKLTSPDRSTTRAKVFVLHEDFDSQTLDNDIGLIQVDIPIRFNNWTGPITLSPREIEAGVEVTISGWGQTSDNATETSDDLNYIAVDTISNSDCRIYYGSVVGPGKFCTAPGNPLKSPCLGDSGGPVFIDSESPRLVGIFSFVNGYGCEEPYPAGHTRISYYRNWIRDKTGI